MKRVPGSSSEIGFRESGPAIADSNSAASATLRPMGPVTLMLPQACAAGYDGTRPAVGRSPTTLQNEAGLRREPPRSLPSAIGTRRAANAAAAPPLDPPGVFDVSYGLRVAPNRVLNVCEPAPNSGVFVFPITIAPAARSRFTNS